MAGDKINLLPNRLIFLPDVQLNSVPNPQQCYCSCPYCVKKCIQREKYIHKVAQLCSGLP